MLIFVAVAAFALLLAPTRGTSTIAPAPLAPIASPAPSSAEVRDPWAKGGAQAAGPSALAREAAEFAAEDVVDPWAQPRPAAPPPLPVLDAPLDPWAQPRSDAQNEAPSAERAPAVADRGAFLDPWNSARTSPTQALPRSPDEPRAFRSRTASLRDPWAKNDERRGTDAPETNVARAKITPSRGAALRDPWAKTDESSPGDPAAAKAPRVKLSKPRLPRRSHGSVVNPWE